MSRLHDILHGADHADLGRPTIPFKRSLSPQESLVTFGPYGGTTLQGDSAMVSTGLLGAQMADELTEVKKWHANHIARRTCPSCHS